jgi:hypothetical protein
VGSIEPARELVIHLPLSRARRPAGPAPIVPGPGRLLVDDPGDAATAAAALGTGAVVGHPFGNVYALTTRPDATTVRSVNLLAGRPPRQVGSVTTTPLRLPVLLDWSRLPGPLAGHHVLGLLDALLGLGPIGFRGPAAAGVPAHLTQLDSGVRTVQVVSPGTACPSNDFLARALRAAGTDLLVVTAAGRSRRLPAAVEEPTHWRATGLRADFGDDPRFLLLEQRDDRDAQARYPAHAPVAPTVLALHTVLPAGAGGRRRLVLERHGSLPAEQVREVVGGFGFDLALGPHARHRLPERDHAAVGA